jgi:hypothetical protein
MIINTGSVGFNHSFRISDRISGRWYVGIANRITTLQPSQTLLYVTPFYVGVPQTFDKIGISVSSINALGTKLRLAIYNDNFLRPSNLLFQSAELDITASPGSVEASMSLLLSGFVWLGVHVVGGDSILNSIVLDTPMSPLVGIEDLNVAHSATAWPTPAYTRPHASGILPTSWGGDYNIVSGVNARAPIAFLRKA